MKGLVPPALSTPDLALRLLQASLLGEWAQSASTLGRAGGDGASRPVALEAITLGLPNGDPAADEAWSDRTEAVQAEARAALQTPFNRPVTWKVR